VQHVIASLLRGTPEKDIGQAIDTTPRRIRSP
jgi:hypothetical protein